MSAHPEFSAECLSVGKITVDKGLVHHSYLGTVSRIGGAEPTAFNQLETHELEEVGGDGFLFFNGTFDRRYVIEVCDGLVPELQRRGLTRTRYAHKHLKDNLLEF